MKINLKILMFIVSSIYHTISPEKIVTFKNTPHEKLISNIELTLQEDNHILGFISYAKIPILNIYFLHTLYIFPEYRNRGNAQYLVRYVLQILQKQNIDTVYVQPGPFELPHHYPPRPYPAPASKEEELQRLVKLYEKCGFKKTDSATQSVVNLIYKMLNIPEDSQYLMVSK